MPAKSKINLLPNEEFEFSNLGKFIKWAVSVGRWIVVLTEFIVIGAFLSRFYFDTVLANLFDEVKQKQIIVDSAASFEENFRSLQDKSKTIKTLLSKETKPSTIIDGINQVLPLNAYLTGISLDGDQMRTSGFGLSESGIKIFVSGLSRQPSLEQVTLSQISSKKDASLGINFDISATIKQK